ncbi:MAG: TolC family protein [Sphingomonadaceae bacterium]
MIYLLLLALLAGVAAPAGAVDGASPQGQGTEASPPPSPVTTALPWWEELGDPQLAALVRQAVAESPGIAIAVARMDRAVAAARATRASLMPELGAGAGATRVRQSLEDPAIRPFVGAPGFQRDLTRLDASLLASWEIDLLGARPRMRSARASASAAMADLSAARISLAAETATVWLNVRELKARLALAEARLESLEQQRRAPGLRTRAGVVAPIDLDRFEGEVEAASAAIPALEVALAGEVARLGVLVGDADMARAAATGADAAAPMASLAPDRLDSLAISLENRPDVIAADLRMSGADSALAAARSLRFPRLMLSGLLSSLAGTPQALFAPPATAAVAAGMLTLPLLDFGRIDAAVAETRAASAEAAASYRQTVLRAAAEVEVAAMAWKRRGEEAARQEAASRALARAEEAAKAAHEAGALDLTTLLDTQRGSIAAKESLAVARAEQARALVALFRAAAGDVHAEASRS